MSSSHINELAWCPDVCPLTGLPFFMWIDHHTQVVTVPTYGGPYVSYTIPVKDADGDFCRERYDHDEGCWDMDALMNQSRHVRRSGKKPFLMSSQSDIEVISKQLERLIALVDQEVSPR